MGNRVILDVVPRHIGPEEWAAAYDEAHKLLRAHPGGLLGHDWTSIGGVALPVYTRALERPADEPAARHWCVVGERTTLRMGGPHTMYRDVSRYLAPTSTPAEGAALVDILFAVPPAAPEASAAVSEPLGRALPAHPVPARGCAPHGGAAPGAGLARVFGDAAVAAPCALPLLAAAMVIEARFPRYAMVHGDVDREQGEAARRWAEGVLGRPIALPVRVEAWRLAERLGARFEDQALVTAVERLLLARSGETAAILRVFPRAEAEPWWLGKLREHADPTGAGALRLLAAYFEANRDLGRLCGLACVDARGPRYAAAALVDALSVLRAQGKAGLEDVVIERALALAFGEDAGRRAALLQRSNPPSAVADADAGAAGRETSLTAELEGLATIAPVDLTPQQRAHVDALAGALRTDAEPPPADGTGLLHAIAELLAQNGPTLTEEAWDLLAGEQDTDLLGFLMALAALHPADADADADERLVRRALFENRGLCRYALGVFQAGAGGS